MKKIIAIVSLYMFPMIVFGAVTNADSLFVLVDDILNKILPVLLAIAVIYFIYNVLMYAIAGDEEKKAAAKSNMIWGIVALFVMVSVWGLVNILINTFGFDGSETPSIIDLINFD